MIRLFREIEKRLAIVTYEVGYLIARSPECTMKCGLGTEPIRIKIQIVHHSIDLRYDIHCSADDFEALRIAVPWRDMDCGIRHNEKGSDDASQNKNLNKGKKCEKAQLTMKCRCLCFCFVRCPVIGSTGALNGNGMYRIGYKDEVLKFSAAIIQHVPWTCPINCRWCEPSKGALLVVFGNEEVWFSWVSDVVSKAFKPSSFVPSQHGGWLLDRQPSWVDLVDLAVPTVGFLAGNEGVPRRLATGTVASRPCQSHIIPKHFPVSIKDDSSNTSIFHFTIRKVDPSTWIPAVSTRRRIDRSKIWPLVKGFAGISTALEHDFPASSSYDLEIKSL